jgi:hypothetical protein
MTPPSTAERMPAMMPLLARTASILLIALAVAACTVGGGTGSVAPTPTRAPVTYAESQASLCASFTSLIRAVGNPDAGTPSAMSGALDAALDARDGFAAEQAGAAMIAELETGRGHAAAAARWEPAASAMGHMDLLLRAFEAHTRAKQAVAAGAAGAIDPQVAFERAGGVAAWTGTLQGIASMPIPAGAVPTACKAFTGTI